MKRILLCTLVIWGFLLTVNAQTFSSDQEDSPDYSGMVRLPHKIIPLGNPVYRILDHYEASGDLGPLPQARPYQKSEILSLLEQLMDSPRLTEKEKKVIALFVTDFMRETTGITLIRQAAKNSFVLVGFGAETSFRSGGGKDATWSTSLMAKPYLSGDLGIHWSFHASMGPSIEQLAPDLFYESYTKDGAVHFPYQPGGYACLPYQFNYETLYTHILIKGKKSGQRNITDGMGIGMFYYTELNGSWLDGVVQVSLNNQHRSWGHDEQNLVLSSTARRFPGIELKIRPASIISYSFLTGSLNSSAQQVPDYKKAIYGYDLGDFQNLLTLHLLEFTPSKWLQVSASAGSIWSKRFELSYLMPFVFPRFSEFEVGNYDNLSMSVDVAFRIPGVGKEWLSFYNDEFSFTKHGPLLRMPRNRYAWQAGWKTTLLSCLLPGTTSTLTYTRVTPFVYTHYPETRFNAFSSRPLDMTYTHDGFNLGFYLPPNSGEFHWSLVNIAIPDLILSLDNRLIIHGTNDLSSPNLYQIYGDVHRYQITDAGGDEYDYPLLDFTRDGIYDHTLLSEVKFDWKVRNRSDFGYFRLVGSLGFSRTWWESNNSGVAAPPSRLFFSGSLGLIVDI